MLLSLILISLLCMTCVSAEDTNGTNSASDVLQGIDDADIQTSAEDNESDTSNTDEVLDSANTTNSESQAYLILDNDADIENVKIGELVVWIISVENMGPDTAKNVEVYDELPDGLEYVKHIATKGTFNPETGIWGIGDLSVSDGEVFLNITTKALTVGEKINKATLTTDSINLNNESYEEEEIDVYDESNVYQVKSALATLHPTGNPIVLIVLSLFGIIISSKREN